VAAARALEHWAYRRSAAITVPTEGMVRLLDARPASRGRAVHMPPGVDLERFERLPEPPPASPLQVLYAGTVGLAHGLETLVDAARLAGPEAVHVTIAGGGADMGAVQRRAAGLANVELLGPVPAERVPELFAAAHAGVVMLRDRELFADALPTKLLECMAAARPVLVSARGEPARLVEEAGAGVAVAPEDPRALAEAFGAVDPAMGAAGRELVTERYGREQMVDRWRALLTRVSSA
jgi:glycosyltransferase involved in cell wall biosynthesis